MSLLSASSSHFLCLFIISFYLVSYQLHLTISSSLNLITSHTLFHYYFHSQNYLITIFKFPIYFNITTALLFPWIFFLHFCVHYRKLLWIYDVLVFLSEIVLSGSVPPSFRTMVGGYGILWTRKSCNHNIPSIKSNLSTKINFIQLFTQTQI